MSLRRSKKFYGANSYPFCDLSPDQSKECSKTTRFKNNDKNKVMKIGPLSIPHFEKLKTILDENSASYQITYDKDELDESHQQFRHRSITPYPTYIGMGDFLYIEIETKDVLLIRAEIEKMGLRIAGKSASPEPEVTEFLCPLCDRTSAHPELCPKHKVRMLEFSEYAEWKRKRERKLSLAVLIVFVVIISVAVLFNHQW
jgi:hypothetical protein